MLASKLKAFTQYPPPRMKHYWITRHLSIRGISNYEKVNSSKHTGVSVPRSGNRTTIHGFKTLHPEVVKTPAGSGNVTERFQSLGEVYSKAIGRFQPTWRTDVNLSPPSAYSGEIPEGDRHIADYYNSLQYTLSETGHPETVDRTGSPRTQHNDGRVTVAVMASPCECVGLLLEGGECIPDGFHLVLSPSWVSQTPSTTDPDLNTLYVHKAITFHKNGQTFIDEFEVPRRVTYFVNFFTNNITGGQRMDGEQFETNIDCPISSPVPLSEIVDNKVWTRNLMADVGMAVPETLAIVYRSKQEVTSTTDKINIVNVEDKDIPNLEEVVLEFLQSTGIAEADQVVVKPSAPSVYGSIGVSYHNTQEVTSVCDAIRDLLVEIQPGSAILVERFIDTLCRRPKDDGINSTTGQKYAFRVRATVCRDFNDVPVTTMINCGVALQSQPINGDNTVIQTLDSTLKAFGVHDLKERRDLETTIRTQCGNVMAAICDRERALGTELRGAVYGQTDVIGIDLCAEDKDGQLVPVGIEANSHDCIINCQIFDFVQNLYQHAVSAPQQPRDTSCEEAPRNSPTIDGSYRPWINTMVTRSQLCSMRGRTLVVIGSGGYSKKYIWEEAAKYGIKVVLVDDDEDCLARDQVHQFIHCDFTDHSNDSNHANTISQVIRRLEITPDGCLTFWEDCGPLAALVRDNLGLGHGASYEAAISGKRKSRTQDLLRSRTDDIPHWPRTNLYTSVTNHVEDEHTLDGIADSMKYPAILKLDHGSSAVGVSLVQDKTELKDEYTRTARFLRDESDFPGVGLGHDNSMVVMEFLSGTEHDVDVVIFDRKLVAAFISDNGSTRVPLFTETVATMPSSLPQDKQAQLVVSAYQCCTEIGLTNGVYNVEIRMTPTGPKLIEINARMGGFYLRDWIKRLYDVDLMLMSMMAASGVKPYVPKRPPDRHMAGVMLVPSLHKHVLGTDKAVQMIRSGEIVLNEFSKGGLDNFSKGDNIDGGLDRFEEPFANIAVAGRTSTEAIEKLRRVCELLDITSDEYKVDEFLCGISDA